MRKTIQSTRITLLLLFQLWINIPSFTEALASSQVDNGGWGKIINPFNSNKLKVGRVQAGPIEISAMGCGTWSW